MASVAAFVASPAPHDWEVGGVTYASYNIVGAVIILPVLRHLTSRRDAVVAGLIAGPLAMAPAIVFFVAMTGVPAKYRQRNVAVGHHARRASRHPGVPDPVSRR